MNEWCTRIKTNLGDRHYTSKYKMQTLGASGMIPNAVFANLIRFTLQTRLHLTSECLSASRCFAEHVHAHEGHI